MRSRTFTRAFLLGVVLCACWVSGKEPFISMAGDCRYPAIASEDNNVYLVWLVAEGRFTGLFFRHSADEGRAWSDAQRISKENINSGMVVIRTG